MQEDNNLNLMMKRQNATAASESKNGAVNDSFRHVHLTDANRAIRFARLGSAVGLTLLSPDVTGGVLSQAALLPTMFLPSPCCANTPE
jgi:hypothetical protein